MYIDVKMKALQGFVERGSDPPFAADGGAGPEGRLPPHMMQMCNMHRASCSDGSGGQNAPVVNGGAAGA